MQFEDGVTKKISYQWSFTIDGDKSNGIDINLDSDFSLGFKQDLSNADAELGTLELTSVKDVNESNPDYEVNVSLGAGENSSTVCSSSYNVDLNFALKDQKYFENDMSLSSPSSLALIGNSLGSARWNEHDDLLQQIKYVQMGDILNKLNGMCFESYRVSY